MGWHARSGAGRRPAARRRSSLEVVDDARYVIGLDLGEFVFRGALVDLRGRHPTARPSAQSTGSTATRRSRVVHELVGELIEALPGGADRLLGIGVGTPGIVDAASGTIRWAVNLDWQDLPLGELLRERYEVPVHVANDTRAAALAIQLFDRPQGAEPGVAAAPAPNLIAIKVGRGIGAGVVIGGELFHGDGFGAGEIGHTAVVDDGAACRCGRFGCLETVASSRAILATSDGDCARSSPNPSSAPGSCSRASSRLADLEAGLADGRRRRPAASSSRPAGTSARSSPPSSAP